MSYNFDHRQLADEMEIYFFNEQIGAGLPMWLPNGVAIRDELESFIKKLEHKAGYLRVSSPHLAKSELYRSSGHLRSYADNMYPPIQWPEDNSRYFLKPMNCPHHHKVFSSQLRSYRQLPLRIAEYGQVYRFENSGSLRGLSRVRSLCQNDAHIYVNPEEASKEIGKVLDLHEQCYMALGLKGYRYRLSMHDPERMHDFDGEQSDWIQCEQILRSCLQERCLEYFEAKGEAAFYAPKIDIQMRIGDAGEESIASVQLDFNSGKKFDLNYISSSGKNEVPWIIHRAPLGSHERFIALLLEYFDGQLPGWLSPVQVYLIPIGISEQKFAEAMRDQMIDKGIRVVLDNNGGSLSKRVMFAHRLRPFAKIVIGPKEVHSGDLNIEFRNEKQRIPISEVLDYLEKILQGP